MLKKETISRHMAIKFLKKPFKKQKVLNITRGENRQIIFKETKDKNVTRLLFVNNKPRDRRITRDLKKNQINLIFYTQLKCF